MKTLTREEKRRSIIDICQNNDITAYQIGKATGMSISGIQRIINGETTKPQEATLDVVLNYLESVAPLGRPNKEEPAREEKRDFISRIELLRQQLLSRHDVIADALTQLINITDDIKDDTSLITDSLSVNFSALQKAISESKSNQDS